MPVAAVRVPVPIAAPVPTAAVIEAKFLDVYPELESRARRIARSFRRAIRDDIQAEVIASAWLNFVQAAKTGRWLNGLQLGWAAWQFVRAHRSVAGSSSTDVMAQQTQQRGRATVHSIASFLRPNPDDSKKPDADRLQRDFDIAIGGRWRESPADRCATKLDWEALGSELQPRLKEVLHGYSRGDRPGEIAKNFNVSPCRVTQLTERLRTEVLEFFGQDLTQPQ